MITRIFVRSNRIRPQTVRSCLRGIMCEIVGEGDVEEGAVKPFDIGIIDIRNDTDMAQLVQLRKMQPALLIVAVVNFGEATWESRAAAQGADDILHAPMSDVRLRMTLQNLIRLRMLERIMRAGKRVAVA